MRQAINHIAVLQIMIVGVVGMMLAGCNLAGASTTPVPTPDIPRIQFLFPDNNQQIFEGADLTLDIYAEDATMGVTMIELLVDGESVNTALAEQLSVPQFRVEMNWFAQGVGLHVLSAVAYRNDGTISEEALIIVDVLPIEGDESEISPQVTEDVSN